MSYQALARKYRPQTFDDILGQESIVRTLQNSIRDERIHQAYLFSGVRGVGKTTTARIFAKALNCKEGPTIEPCNTCTICSEITEGIDLDVREIDAATYTTVDNVRELREVTQFQPARDRNRIFIIDEAHMLSTGAWNALLKLIEEPPPHVVFIMATTEMHTVPPTILSRVQQFIFRTVTVTELVSRLTEICRAEEIEATNDALEIIARRGDGSVRDALSLLDQIVAFSGQSVSAADVSTVLGLSDQKFFSALVRSIHEGNQSQIIETLEESAESGRDFKLLYRDILAYLRDLMLIASGADESLLRVEADDREALREVAGLFDSTELLRLLNVLIQDDELIQRSEQQRLAVEIAILKAATLPRLRAVEEFLSSPDKAAASYASRATTTRDSTRKAPPKSTREGSLIERITEEVAREKKMTGSQLALAKSARHEGDTVTIEFDENHAFTADQLGQSEHYNAICAAAEIVFGKPTEVRFQTSDKPSPDSKPSKHNAIEQDPVVRAFAEHLGGEVVSTRKRKGQEVS